MKRMCVILAALWPVLAFGATVESTLSASETAVGVPVVVEVRVDGTTSAIVPRELEIDGLPTVQTNRSTQVQLINGQLSTSAVYRYKLMPTREGEFEIPAIEVNVGGKKESTKPHRLVVKPGTGPAPRIIPPGVAQPQQRQHSQAPDADQSTGRIAYAEVIVPKKTIYAGELVPVEIRFYFNNSVDETGNRYYFQPRVQEPRFSGEGFTVAKLVQGDLTDQVIDGQDYQVLTYKTAITAVKSGELEIPAVSFPVYAEMPSSAPGGFFGQFFGNAPGMFRETREMDVTSEPFKIQVKPLPREGRPAGFSGAIGEFAVTSSADPVKAGPGDPITLRLAIAGQGNFDTLTPPKLIDADGWRVYPATERFEMSDTVGFSGTKLFDQPIVAQTAQTQTPVAEFSFFDPAKEEYVTLRSEPVPVEAEASGNAPAAVATKSESTPTPQATPAETGRWIADMRTRNFRPILKTPAFWIVNGVAALAVVGAIGVALARRAGSGPAAHRRALARRRDHLLRGLESQPDEGFLEKAVEAMSIQAELDGVGGAVEWVRRESAHRSAESTRELEAILDRADAAKFAGGTVAIAVDPESRRRAVAALKEACK